MKSDNNTQNQCQKIGLIKEMNAEKIKEALIQSESEDPLEQIIMIGESVFEFINNADEKTLDFNKLKSAFFPLQKQFKFYSTLLGY